MAAFAIALFVNLADWAPRYDVFIGTAPLDRQLRLACAYPSAPVKWIFEAREQDAGALCGPAAEQDSPGKGGTGIAPPPGQMLFNGSLMAQQFLIVFFAALAVMQILLHTLLFAVFERLAIAPRPGSSSLA